MAVVPSTFGGFDTCTSSASICAARQSFPRHFFGGPSFPCATRLPFESFNNKHAGGTCYVVGRGPTDFDYRDLANVTDPVFFINDAVCLEQYVRSEMFFFAHDAEMRVWLDGAIKSTAVLPVNGSVLCEGNGVALGHAGAIVYYQRREQDRSELLRMSRDEAADREELFAHSGTIHSLLHFVWFCGFARIIFIGCDGINQRGPLARATASQDGYDRRLKNKSNTAPWWRYEQIRKAQDLMTTLFGIEAVYVGTPVCRTLIKRPNTIRPASPSTRAN